MAPKGKCGKHYTAIDKNIFLDILKDYKHIVEQKKSDTTSLREKDLAWAEITNKFNDVLQISETRTVSQLKKLWSNMKQNQRDALTREKQSRMATGGGPEVPTCEIDPAIAAIVPHLMTVAPTEYSSNITAEEQAIAIDTIDDEDNIMYPAIVLDLQVDPAEPTTSCSSETETPVKPCKRMRLSTASKKPVAQRLVADAAVSERLEALLKQDQELFEIKREHELKTGKLKIEHLQKIQALELRKATAEAELAECNLAHKMI